MLLAASIDPARRGETLTVADFVRLLQRSGRPVVTAAAEHAEDGAKEPGNPPGALTRLPSCGVTL